MIFQRPPPWQQMSVRLRIISLKKSPCMNFSIFIEIPQIYTYKNSKISDACIREKMSQWEQLHSLPFEISTQLNHNKFIPIDLLMHLEYLENVDVKCP